jgi:hypothetical protein
MRDGRRIIVMRNVRGEKLKGENRSERKLLG